MSLHDAIARAQTSSQSRIANEQVNVVRGQVRQAGLGLNPRMYVSTEDVQPWNDQFSFANKTEDYGYIGQTFEIDGKRSKRVQLANANLRRSRAEAAFQMRQTVSRVAASYWLAVAGLRVSELLQQDLTAVDEILRYHKERVDAGAMRGVDLLRVQIERDRVFMALQIAHRDSELALVDLFRQIGIPYAKNTTLTGSLSDINPVPPVQLNLVLTQRDDLIGAREAVAAAEADLKLQNALGVPDPDVLLGYKRNSGADTLFASLQLPLGFRNRNQGEIERAEASIRLAHARLEQTELTIRAEIEEATRSYEAQRTIVHDVLPDMQERAKRNLDILKDAYRSGGVDLLRYIDAERTEIDTEVSSLRALLEYRQSVVRLEIATGMQP